MADKPRLILRRILKRPEPPPPPAPKPAGAWPFSTDQKDPEPESDSIPVPVPFVYPPRDYVPQHAGPGFIYVVCFGYIPVGYNFTLFGSDQRLRKETATEATDVYAPGPRYPFIVEHQTRCCVKSWATQYVHVQQHILGRVTETGSTTRDPSYGPAQPLRRNAPPW